MDERDIELPSWVLYSRLLFRAPVSNSDVTEFCFFFFKCLSFWGSSFTKV